MCPKCNSQDVKAKSGRGLLLVSGICLVIALVVWLMTTDLATKGAMEAGGVLLLLLVPFSAYKVVKSVNTCSACGHSWK